MRVRKLIDVETKSCQVGIELDPSDVVFLYSLLNDNKNHGLTKLQRALGRVVRDRQFEASYKAEIKKLITQIKKDQIQWERDRANAAGTLPNAGKNTAPNVVS